MRAKRAYVWFLSLLVFIAQSPRAAAADFDLTSTTADVSAAPIFAGGGPTAVTIDNAGTPQVVTSSSTLTPAQFVAAQQAHADGTHELLLSAQGAAVGGTFQAESLFNLPFGTFNGLNVPAAVTALHDVSQVAAIFQQIGGNFINSGSYYLYSSSAATTSATVQANTITNNADAIISSVLPASILSVVNSAVSQLDFTLQATVGNLVNHGTISSSGNLTVAAAGQLINSTTGTQTALIQAANTLNLVSQNITNSAHFAATAGNINVQGLTFSQNTNLIVNNIGGTVEALNGAIKFRPTFFGTSNLYTALWGGNWKSQTVDILSGTGQTVINVDDLTGVLNVTGSEANIVTSSADLNIGTLSITGTNPLTIANSGGNLLLTADINQLGNPVALIAAGNITAAAGIDVKLGNSIIVAGGNLLSTVPTAGSAPAAGAYVNTLTISQTNAGRSASGGNIDFSGLTTFEAAVAAGSGEGVEMVARRPAAAPDSAVGNIRIGVEPAAANCDFDLRLELASLAAALDLGPAISASAPIDFFYNPIEPQTTTGSPTDIIIQNGRRDANTLFYQGPRFDFNLASESRTLSAAPLFGGGGPASVIIDKNGTAVTVNASSMVTPAEYIAAQQMILSGVQDLLLGDTSPGTGGFAQGGFFVMNTNLLNAISGLSIPADVSVFHDRTTTSAMQFTGDLANAGNIFAFSTLGGGGPAIRSDITAKSILNAQDAVILTKLPSSVTSSLPPVSSNLDLALTALFGNFDNSGLIESAGHLAVSAQGELKNVTAGTSTAALLAAKGISLSSTAITNSGIIRAAEGNVDVRTPSNSSISFSNINGLVQALAGSIGAAAGQINFRQSINTGNLNTVLWGGDWLSDRLNIFSGSGKVVMNVGSLPGTLSLTAGKAFVSAHTPVLTVGSLNLASPASFSGPTEILMLANSGGHLRVNSHIDLLQVPVTLLASGDVVAGASGNAVRVKSGNLLAVAGANIVPRVPLSGSAPDLSTYTDALFIDGANGGKSASGGSVDFMHTQEVTGSNNSTLELVARPGSTSGSGRIIIGSTMNCKECNIDLRTELDNDTLAVKAGNVIGFGTAISAINGAISQLGFYSIPTPPFFVTDNVIRFNDGSKQGNFVSGDSPTQWKVGSIEFGNIGDLFACVESLRTHTKGDVKVGWVYSDSGVSNFARHSEFGLVFQCCPGHATNINTQPSTMDSFTQNAACSPCTDDPTGTRRSPPLPANTQHFVNVTVGPGGGTTGGGTTGGGTTGGGTTGGGTTGGGTTGGGTTGGGTTGGGTTGGGTTGGGTTGGGTTGGGTTGGGDGLGGGPGGGDGLGGDGLGGGGGDRFNQDGLDGRTDNDLTRPWPSTDVSDADGSGLPDDWFDTFKGQVPRGDETYDQWKSRVQDMARSAYGQGNSLPDGWWDQWKQSVPRGNETYEQWQARAREAATEYYNGNYRGMMAILRNGDPRKNQTLLAWNDVGNISDTLRGVFGDQWNAMTPQERGSLINQERFDRWTDYSQAHPVLFDQPSAQTVSKSGGTRNYYSNEMINSMLAASQRSGSQGRAGGFDAFDTDAPNYRDTGYPNAAYDAFETDAPGYGRSPYASAQAGQPGGPFDAFDTDAPNYRDTGYPSSGRDAFETDAPGYGQARYPNSGADGLLASAAGPASSRFGQGSSGPTRENPGVINWLRGNSDSAALFGPGPGSPPGDDSGPFSDPFIGPRSQSPGTTSWLNPEAENALLFGQGSYKSIPLSQLQVEPVSGGSVHKQIYTGKPLLGSLTQNVKATTTTIQVKQDSAPPSTAKASSTPPTKPADATAPASKPGSTASGTQAKTPAQVNNPLITANFKTSRSITNATESLFSLYGDDSTKGNTIDSGGIAKAINDKALKPEQAAGAALLFAFSQKEGLSGKGVVERAEVGMALSSGNAKENLPEALRAAQQTQLIAGAAPLADSLKQGAIGDCRFITVLKGVVEHDASFVQNSIKSNADGSFTVKTPGMSQAVNVTLTPGEKAIGVRANGLWAAVLEKAYAQTVGTGQAVAAQGAEAKERDNQAAMKFLMGDPKIDTVRFHGGTNILQLQFPADANTANNKLNTAFQQNGIVTAEREGFGAPANLSNVLVKMADGSGRTVNLQLEGGHDYQVLRSDKNGVTIWNPHGQLRDASGQIIPNATGTFKLTLQQFHQNFSGITIGTKGK